MAHLLMKLNLHKIQLHFQYNRSPKLSYRQIL
nr:MAG TPA: hypothetical protein [Bacteriophage sp.]